MAGTKITALTEDTTPASTDIVAGVKDPGGTPLNRKLTYATLFDTFRPISYGSLTVADNVGAEATTTPGTWQTIAAFDTVGDVSGVTGDASANTLTVTNAGEYEVGYDLTYGYTTGASNDVAHKTAIAIDGTVNTKTQQTTEYARNVAAIGHAGGGTILALTAGQVLTLKIQSIGDATAPIISNAQLRVRRVA